MHVILLGDVLALAFTIAAVFSAVFVAAFVAALASAPAFTLGSDESDLVAGLRAMRDRVEQIARESAPPPAPVEMDVEMDVEVEEIVCGEITANVSAPPPPPPALRPTQVLGVMPTAKVLTPRREVGVYSPFPPVEWEPDPDLGSNHVGGRSFALPRFMEAN